MAKLKAKVPARPRVPPLPALPSLQELKDRSAFERLLYSIREVESQHDRAAFNPRSGARGSMQIVPKVHEAGAGYGVPLLPTGASPEQMEAHGRVYFERLLETFGNARDAAIAYNWGPTNARNWIKSGRKVEALPKETRDYVARISNFYQRESSLPLDKQMPKGRVLRREEIPPPPPQPAPSVLGAPPQTASQPSPVEPSPVEPSPVPPFVAPEEEQFDWMGPAMGGSPPVREPRAANRERDAAAALALLEQARRFLPPGPRPVAFADGGPVDLATVASAGSGPDEEMRRGLGSLVDRAKAMFPTPSSAPLFDDTGYERGTVLPLRRNIETGAMEFATPGLIAEPLNAMQRSVAAMRSGQQVQPGDVAEALGLVGATSLALPGSLTRVPAGALGAMKPRGGNWLTETVDDNLSSVIYHPDVIRAFRLEELVPISEWIHRNYRNYILRDMGTPDDPVRKAIDEGVTFGTFAPDDSISPIRRISKREGLEGKRRAEGFPPEGYATTPEGKIYETITDEIIDVARREDFLPENVYGSRFVDPYEEGKSGTITPKRIPPWIEKTKPETKINVLGNEERGHELNIFHNITHSLVDTLRRASDPYSGLPGNLTVSPEKMKYMSVPDVLRLADDISAWRQAEADKALKAAFRESSLVKELPDFDLAFAKGKGGAWVELPPAVDEKGVRICTSIGSAGGWCTMDEKMAVYYGEQGKLFALLDGDGRPHIQISSVGPDIEEIKFPENSPSGERSKSYEKKDKEYIDKVSKAVIDFLNGRKLGYVNQSDIRELSVGGRPIIDKNRPTGSSKLSEKENDAIRQKHPELFQEGAPRFFVAPPVGFAEGGAVRVPEGEPDEMTSGVGSLAGRAREMFRVEPLDYRPAARGARAAAERLGEELSAPGRAPAPDTRQQLERMARDALEAGKVAGELGYELTVPGDLTDVALMALMGPGGRLMKTGIGAALMALDPEEAEAGKIKALQEAAAKIRRSALPAEKRATRALSKKPPVVDPVEESPYPGVFGMSPAQKAAEASTRVEQESPWLKTLFGVTRDDLYEISKRKGDRPGEIAEVDNPRGSGLAYQVMTERNAQRLQDELAEAQKYPAMFRPMHAWYVMDPAYQRLLQIMPKNEADAAYARMNSFVASASPMSEPVAEIPRGLAANMMENEGLFDIFRKVGGKEAGKRVEALRSEGLSDEEVKRVLDKVPGLERFPGHSAHMTHAEMMGKLRGNEYKVISDSPKVRVYSQASGVAEHPYGFQTDSLIADAGLTRNMGFAEISRSKTPGDSLGNAPYRDIRPWWANKVAGPMGMEGVQAQAVNWATSSPATGVGTSLGSTKLELLARYIGQRATELGVDPIVFRDLVLSGKAFANGGEVHSGVGSLAAKARDMTRRAV